jgi:uncharacterized membrane protein HdeD (DUF308 family)
MTRDGYLYAALIFGLLLADALVYCVCLGIALLWDRNAQASTQHRMRSRHWLASAGVLIFSLGLMLWQMPTQPTANAVGWLAVTALLPALLVIAVARFRIWLWVPDGPTQTGGEGFSG